VPVVTAGRVTGSSGRKLLSGIRVTGKGAAAEYVVDTLAVSGGFNPEISLSCMFGSRPVWSEAHQAFLPAASGTGVEPAGAAAGRGALNEAWVDGARAAAACLARIGRRAHDLPPIATTARGSEVMAPAFWSPARPQASHVFLDLQHDVTAADVELAHREGYRSVEHLKRYTTLGMATDQGRGSSVDGLALMAQLMDRPVSESGVVLARPPVIPLALGALAGLHRGEGFRPVRRSPVHAFAEEQGALFVDSGQWKRPLAWPRSGETFSQTVEREVNTVRSAVGVTDVSTLGKIEVEGPDAAAFLDHVCAIRPSQMKVGRGSYLVLLREDGHLMDDGMLVRFAADRYVVYVSTAHAAAAWRHILYCRQVLWPQMQLSATAVTDAWAQFAVAGPRASHVIAALVDAACAFDPAAFPMQSAAEYTVCGGIPARLVAASFSGERAYEIAVPTGYGEALFRRILIVGEEHGIAPYGTEAMGVMRIEKGHPAGGEINGQTTAFDLGLGRMLAQDRDYIGRVLSQRPALIDPARHRLVGLKPVNPAHRFKGGAHVVAEGASADAAHDLGWLTSVAWSPTLGHSIALALVKGGPDRTGERVRVIDPLRGEPDISAEIVPSCFVDPERKRQHVE
jgi:methylglutamate dehydrogenase subunit C